VSAKPIPLEPHDGWSQYARTTELVDFLWDELAAWHYLNPTSEISIWEAGDGSSVYVAFEDRSCTRIAELVVSTPASSGRALPCSRSCEGTTRWSSSLDAVDLETTMEPSRRDDLLFATVARELEQSIASGALRRGDRLPSLRQLQQARGISLSTAFRAYVELEARGWIEARPRSGFFVCGPPHARPDAPRSSGRTFGPRAPMLAATAAEVVAASLDPSLVPFGASTLSAEWLPAKHLARILRGMLASGADGFLGYALSDGDPHLKRQLSRRSTLWGSPVGEEEIVVTAGCTEALSLALQAVAPARSTVVVESPTHFGFLQLLRELGHPVLALPTDPEHGLDPAALRQAMSRHAVGACLLTPSFQNPLGALMPDERKEEIVTLTHRLGVPIIEDDIYGELSFQHERPSLMRRFDRKGLVTTCGSVSKCLAPGFRVGWCLPGARSLDAVRRLKIATSMCSPSLQQRAVATFLEGGAFDRHLRRLRERLRTATGEMTRALLRHFPAECRFVPPRGGNMFWVELPRGSNATELCRRARAAGISIVPGDLFAPGAAYRNHVRLTCTRPFDRVMERAIARLGDLIRG